MRKDISGRKFGRWSVIEFSGIANGNKSMWKCRCDCGVESSVRGDQLISGTSKSCGCLKREMLRDAKLLPVGESILNKLFSDYKRNYANDFILTKKEFTEFIIQNCFYCGEPPKEVPISKSHQGVTNGTMKANGIDRVNSDEGHHFDNCVPCCYKCNRMKSDLSINDWLAHMKKVVKFMSGLAWGT